MAGGFIPAWRKVFGPEHWLRPTKRDPASRLHAWLDCCQMATYRPRETRNSGTLNRGEFVASLRTLGDHWCWSKDRVRRFMSELEVRTAIATVRETPDGTVYHIVNYDAYAVVDNGECDTGSDSERDRNATAARQEQTDKQETTQALSAREAKPKGKRGTALPADWTPNEGHQRIAAEEGVGLIREAEKFKDHHLAKGSVFKDWDRAFNNWLRRAMDYGGNHGGDHGGAAPGEGGRKTAGDEGAGGRRTGFVRE